MYMRPVTTEPHVDMREGLPVLGVVRPHSSADRGPDDDQQLPQPYRGEHSPVAPLDDSIQPQGQQHGEEQQARVDQELAAAGDKRERYLTGVPHVGSYVYLYSTFIYPEVK